MKFNKEIYIGNKLISNNSPTFVIAEAGVNHGGDINIAKQLIDVAVKAKADAVKFQTFKAERSILKNVQKAPYQKETTSANESQFDMLKKLELNKQQHHFLKKYCMDKNIIFLTTPFDEQSLDELDELDLPAYKISSSDTTNIPLLIKIAKKRKPIILSTGMSYLSEVSLALQTICQYNNSVILLHCTANYPMDDKEANLAVINTFRDNFDILLGYSDHSIGIGVSPFTIPMGARLVEKHFTLDKNDLGPDHLASLSPDELVDFVKIIHKVDEYIGSNIKEPTISEHRTRKSLQKCLVANCNIKKGESFSEDNIVAKRTGGIGISPIFYKEIIGMKAKKNFNTNDIIEK